MNYIVVVLIWIIPFTTVGQEESTVETKTILSTHSDSSSTKQSDEDLGKDDLIINPQPKQNYLGIKVSKDLSGYYRYSLINQDGKCNSSGHVYLNHEENSISIKNLKSGSYSLHVSGKSLSSIQKIDIKK
jgi:PDZ domain-containing secreted protein